MSIELRERAEFWERRAKHLTAELNAVRRTIGPLEIKANRDHKRANELHDLALTAAEDLAGESIRPTFVAKHLQKDADRIMDYEN